MTDAPPGVHLAARAARRVALAAQGFARPRPALPGTRDLQRVVDAVGVVQIDSVNVLVRSHYLPFFSRLGPYDRALLDRARDVAPPPGRRVLGARGVARAAVHLAAARLPDAPGPLGRLGRDASRGEGATPSSSPPSSRRSRAGSADEPRVEAALAHDLPRERDEWGWNWSLVKMALEHLFWAGEVSERRAHEPVRAAVRPPRPGAAPARVLEASTRGAP